MTKKKSAKKVTLLSPEKYIQTKARTLPLKECLVMKDWKELGISNVIVARQHASGNITMGVYLVDIYCLGVKDTLYRYNISEVEYQRLKDSFSVADTLVEIPYVEVHNLIYGAVAYAEELGIPPHKDFKITEKILEEDDDNIPFIEMEFGSEGKPLLMVDTLLEASKYTPALEANAVDGYELFIDELNEDEDEEFFDDENESMGFMERDLEDGLVHTIYNYTPPEYPTELNLVHAELNDLYIQKNKVKSPAEMFAKILSLPHESLIDDLIHILHVEMGKMDVGDTWDLDVPSPVVSVLLLLGELKDDRAFPVLLELLRQDEFFMEIHLGMYVEKTLPLTIYYLGRTHLPELLDFMKEPDLNPMLRFTVTMGVAYIGIHEKERRGEVIKWYHDLIHFYIDHATDPHHFDATQVSMMLSDLVDIRAVELIPDISKLFDEAGLDIQWTGEKEEVLKKIALPPGHTLHDYTLYNIVERYSLI